MYFLEMNAAETGLLFFFLYLVGFIIFMACLRWAVRANDITKNQQAIIWFMILQCKKQGATDEEIKKIKDAFNIP
jgi:hypothetical protein